MKNYEKPLAEMIVFETFDVIMDADAGEVDPNISTEIEEW